MAITEKLCATDFVLHGTGADIRGLKDFKQHDAELFDAFPDIHFTIDDIVVEGDEVAMRYTMTGTHKGAFMGTPPTDKKVRAWAIEIDRILGGKFVEGWVRLDTLDYMQQLGVAPAPKKN
jgi:predicted ester cyclase